MTFPFESLSDAHRAFGLVVAGVIGFFFGFVLERAGFGRATKLAGQFYLHDMTVFKVMFGAIVTALLGLVIASGFGLADFQTIADSAASTTYFWPMLVGGLLLGAGFIVSGYCPGTSLVATASGNLDGLFTIVGVGIGSLVFGEFFPLIQEFYVSGESGQLFLYQLFGISPSVLAVGVVLMAVGGFVGAEAVEKLMASRLKKKPQGLADRPRRAVFAGFGIAAVFGVIMLAVPVDSPMAEDRTAEGIDAETLARRLLDEPWKLFIVDVRDRAAYEKERIPGSEHVSPDALDAYGLAYHSGVKDLVLIVEEDLTVASAVMSYPGRIYVLVGGFEAWRTFALEEPARLPLDASAEQRADHLFRASVFQKMTGVVAAPPPPAKATRFQPPTKKKGGGCDG